MNNYVYLLREREFIKTGECIYKIGKTKQERLNRFQNYPNGSELLIHLMCIDCNIAERELIKIFCEKYKQRKDIGTEYFEGNSISMINTILIFMLETNKCSEYIDKNKAPLLEPAMDYLVKSIKNKIKPNWLVLNDGILRFHLKNLHKEFCKQSGPTDSTTLRDVESRINKYIGNSVRIQIHGKRQMGYSFTVAGLKERISCFHGDDVSNMLFGEALNTIDNDKTFSQPVCQSVQEEYSEVQCHSQPFWDDHVSSLPRSFPGDVV
jgi:hypothetical protein